MAHMIEMRKVSKFYSQNNTVSTGFSRVSLDLDVGDFVVITGESGGGKSTLLNVISGLDTYEEGEMFVNGEDISAFTTEEYEDYRKTYIGNIFQDFNLINSYTVYQNVELVLLLNGHKSGNLKGGIMKILDWVGLKKYARTKVSKLSGGQKQRVAIARAFAKNSPIIVADEPTGNLDSESAVKVMEILAAMARDRLVIVVTHNYEQAEPYATRKIMMRDGRIIEDNRIRPPFVEQEGSDDREQEKSEDAEEKSTAEAIIAADKAEKERLREEARLERERREERRRRKRLTRLRKRSQLRLGIRNAFNLPTKFLLLLFIYLFVTAAVVGVFTSMQTAQHEQNNVGEAEYFFDSSPERIVLRKADRSVITDEDVASIRGMEQVDHVVLNDLALDRIASLESEKVYVEGPVYSVDTLEEKDLAYGSLPRTDREIVIGVDDTSDSYETLKDMGQKIIGKKYYVTSYDNQQGESGRISEKKCIISGITFKKAEAQKIRDYGYSRFYVRENLANKMLIASVAISSKTELKFGDKIISAGTGQKVYVTDKLKAGQAIILDEDAQSYFVEGKAVGKPMQIRVTNHYFKSRGKFTIAKVVTPKTIKEDLGYKRDAYDTYVGCVFISAADYAKLYDQGNYQVSAFVKDDRDAQDVAGALRKSGYEALAMKDILENETGDLQFASRMISACVLILMFLVLFFIAYTVIRLIMRSRNEYFSILRILGATQRNTRNILRIELLVIMTIAVGISSGFLVLVERGMIDLPMLKTYLNYVEPVHYAVLFLVMLFMSLLIASRYSKRIFSQSAMRVYRGGEQA